MFIYSAKPDGDSTTASQTMTPITATTPSDTQNEICETQACVTAGMMPMSVFLQFYL